MDTITHGLLGAVTAQVGFRRRIGRDAPWVAALAAILPDLDILATPFLSLTGAEANDFTTFVVHRGLSHSLLIAPVLSAPVAGLWWWFRKRTARNRESKSGGPAKPPSFRLLYACVLTALVATLLLDWCTSYGTQLLAPLTNTRFAIDVVPIVDFLYTSLLVLTLLACYVVRKVRRAWAHPTAAIIAWVGFSLSVGYLVAGQVMHDWAVRKATRTAGVPGDQVVRADAYPALGTILLWRAVIETKDRWIAVRIHHLSRQPSDAWRRQSIAKSDSPWIEKARDLPAVRTYAWFAGNRLRAQHAVADGHHVVEFHDMRYCFPTEGLESFWPLTVIFSDTGEVLHVGRQHATPHSSTLRAAWSDLWNP